VFLGPFKKILWLHCHNFSLKFHGMKQVYMETFGCQMNVADTDRMELLLSQSGYARTQEKEHANLILINTCAIRDKAEQKIYSLFGGLRPLKTNNPDVVFGLAGCLAQQEQSKLLKKIPDLDFIIGPDYIEKISDTVQKATAKNSTQNLTEFDQEKSYSIPPMEGPRDTGPSALVNIIKGCDKFCSFCVVPFTRGREKSREADEIYAEIRQLVDLGVKEIILLGQNVNAYGKRGLDTPVAFHELLYRAAEIRGVKRLRFTTSYPRDVTPELIHAYRDIDVLVNHLHLPVQSGNDRILEEMRRGHTAEEYCELIDHLRSEVPDIALSTDIIVGYPDETESEFEDTLHLMEKMRFSTSFMFTYSSRPGTPAALVQDSVPEQVKKDRLQRTIQLQDRLTAENARLFIGKNVEVLVENIEFEPEIVYKGRNPEYWRVIFTADRPSIKPGDLVWVKVDDVRGRTLKGKLIAQ
jgi:tRNA-2-methylthio-N6-dimethylallyladenosine synthase